MKYSISCINVFITLVFACDTDENHPKMRNSQNLLNKEDVDQHEEVLSGSGDPEPDLDDPTDDEPVPCTVETGSHLPVPAESSLRFKGSCASCHGARAEGHEEFVGSIIDINFEAFESYARIGLNYGMPAFNEDEYPSAFLEYDWAWLNGVGAVLSEGCTDGPMNLPADLSIADAEAMLNQGMDAWYLPDGDGMSCANCHGAEPMDLALQGYTVGDVLRRALLHLNGEEAWDITYTVLAKRHLADMNERDPVEHAPFQPAGRMLDPAEVVGVSDSVARDHAFGLAWIGLAPGLSSPAIADMATAGNVLNTIQAIDLAKLPVGFQMKRWTVDAIRGTEFRQFGEWIPEVAHVGNNAERMEQLFSDYRTDPTDEHLQNLLLWSTSETTLVARMDFSIDPDSLAADIYRAKYASVLLAQHMMGAAEHGANPRSELTGSPYLSVDTEIENAGLVFNPWWQLATESARAHEELATCGRGDICAGFTPDIQVDDVPTSSTLQAEVTGIETPWGWLGFLYDNALDSAGPDGVHAAPEGYIQRLAQSGFTNHATLLLIRRNLEITRGGAGWLRVYGDATTPSLAADRADWRGIDALLEPSTSEEVDAIRVQLLAQSVRAFTWALTEELETSGRVFGRGDPSTGSSLTADYRGGIEVFEAIHGPEWSPTHAPPESWTEAAKNDAQMYAQVRHLLGTACDATTDDC
jgi:hypothetical protein